MRNTAFNDIGNVLGCSEMLSQPSIYPVKQPGKTTKALIADLDQELEPFSADSCLTRFAMMRDNLSKHSGNQNSYVSREPMKIEIGEKKPLDDHVDNIGQKPSKSAVP